MAHLIAVDVDLETCGEQRELTYLLQKSNRCLTQLALARNEVQFEKLFCDSFVCKVIATLHIVRELTVGGKIHLFIGVVLFGHALNI